MNERNLLLLLSHAFFGVAFFFVYTQYVQSIFLARTNFDQLSSLSREALLRKEDALHYSFYKTIIEEPDFWQGYKKLLNSSVIEYPNSINIVKRFHVLPEIIVGYFYHFFKYYSTKFGIPMVTCWSTAKNSESSDVDIICDGVGEPFHFYLEFVWALGGFTVFLIYLYGSFLSENLFGGFYAVVLYIIFHKNASKIYERPMSRENFAFPFIFWQFFYLSLCFEHAARYNYVKLKFRIVMVIKLTLLTMISLLSWQFSSVIFATQILVMITPWSLGLVSNWFSVDFALSHFFATLLAFYFSYGNKKYFLSWQNGPAIALFCISTAKMLRGRSSQATNSSNNVINNNNSNNISSDSMLKNLTLGILMAFTSQGTLIDLFEQCGFSKPEDNPFSVYRDLILHWSLQRRANFSISLLACNTDFTEIDWHDFWELLKQLFVKPYCLYGIVLLAKFFRKWRIKNPKDIKLEQIERAKNYILEDFLEENHITMKEMSNKETELELNLCFKLLEKCNYDYDMYKREKINMKTNKNDEHDNFVNDVKKLKEEINENRKEKKIIEENINKKSDTAKSNSSHSPVITKQKDNKSYNSKRIQKQSIEQAIENIELGYHYLYSVAQLCILSLIGLSIKKLFFLCYTLGCVIAPTLCSKVWYKKQNNVFWTISLIVFFTSIIDPGINNIQQEFHPVATDSNELKNMLEWINLNTEKDAVFGGPIEIIGTIHLTTRRPIVNHPYLEMRQISERTESIYSVFSRQQSSDIYNQFSQLKIQYLVLAFSDCTNASSNDEMCDILSIWDELQPSLKKYPQFCAELANKNIPSFLKVFANKDYGIIKMFSQSVQLNLKYNKMSEKIM